MSNLKFEKITFKYMSYNKINFLTEKGMRNFKTLFFILNLIKRHNNVVNIKFANGRKYTKVFTVVKGPMCHKTGKHILKYNYYTYYITITRSVLKNKSLKNIEKYFYYLLSFFSFYDTNICSINKYILNTYVNIM